MKNSDKFKRAIAFYMSVILFFVTLPILLSYSLGYRIDYRSFKVYKTGIIFINSKPSGASIYINEKIIDAVTPAEIEDLKPAIYKVRVRREGFYPWEEELVVRPNMVTKADSIILFPVIQEMNKINSHPSSDFTISDRGCIYYFSESGLFSSDIDGGSLKKLSPYSKWPDKIIRKRFSPDGDKILCFNGHEISVVYLNLDKVMSARVESILTTEEPIIDVFWYAGSGYIIVVTEKYINVLELRGGGKRNVATLYKFNLSPHAVSYDSNNGSLYFLDSPKGSSSKDGSYLYRLDLRQKLFDYLMQLLLKRDTDVQREKR